MLYLQPLEPARRSMERNEAKIGTNAACRIASSAGRSSALAVRITTFKLEAVMVVMLMKVREHCDIKITSD